MKPYCLNTWRVFQLTCLPQAVTFSLNLTEIIKYLSQQVNYRYNKPAVYQFSYTWTVIIKGILNTFEFPKFYHFYVIVMKILWLKYLLIETICKIYFISERISKVFSDNCRRTGILATIKSMKFGDLYLMCCQYRIVNFGILVQ